MAAGCREVELDGYLLPKGTLVDVATYSVHRQAEAYPEPEVFQPDRWLSEGQPFQGSPCSCGLVVDQASDVLHAIGAG